MTPAERYNALRLVERGKVLDAVTGDQVHALAIRLMEKRGAESAEIATRYENLKEDVQEKVSAFLLAK